MDNTSGDEQKLLDYFDKLKTVTNLKDLHLLIGEIEYILDKPKVGLQLALKFFPFLSEGIHSKAQDLQYLCIDQLSKIFKHAGEIGEQEFVEKIGYLEEKGVWKKIFEIIENSEEEKIPSEIIKTLINLTKGNKEYVRFLYDKKTQYKGLKKGEKSWEEYLGRVLKHERIEVKMRAIEFKLELRRELKNEIEISEEMKELMKIWNSDDLLAKMGAVDVLQKLIEVLKLENETDFINLLKDSGLIDSCLNILIKELNEEEPFLFTPPLFRLFRTISENSENGIKFLIELEKMKTLLNESFLSDPIKLKSGSRQSCLTHILGLLQITCHFSQFFGSFQNYIKWIWFNLCVNTKLYEEVRIASFHCLASIVAECFQNKVPNSSAFFKDLFNNISSEWTSTLMSETKDIRMSTTLKCAIYALFQACSLYDWGVIDLFKNPNFFDFIIDRSTEEKAGREAKYEVLFTIFKNPFTPKVVDEEKFDFIDQYLRKGPLVDTNKKDKLTVKTESN